MRAAAVPQLSYDVSEGTFDGGVRAAMGAVLEKVEVPYPGDAGNDGALVAVHRLNLRGLRGGERCLDPAPVHASL